MRFIIAMVMALVMAPAAQAASMTVLLDWFVNPDHGPLVVAKAQGFFADEGLEVDLIAPANPNDPPKLVAAGQAELAITYQPNLHIMVAEGLPLRRVGTLVATPLNSLVVEAGGPVTGLADLKGQRIGYSVGGFEDALLGRMLESAGLKLDDVELINVNFNLTPALLSGQVAGVIGAFRNFELTQIALEGAEGRAFYPEEHGVPAYDELVLVARADATDDPRLAAFLRALERGVQYMINHPDDAWQAFIAAHPDLDDELNRRAWADTLPRFALRPAALDRARYRRFAEFLVERGLIPEALPVADYATVIDTAR